jgi:Holliday junction DNA helicase RuvA
MIEFLRGTLLEKRPDHLVVDVGGVGYGLSVPAPTAAQAGDPGAPISLWVRTYVREDTLRLFGFATRHEREVFDVMLGLSGVGPALAMTILSSLTIADLVQAALAGDPGRLKKVKGIGPKTAEKLVLELKGRADRLAASLPPEVREAATSQSEASNPLLQSEAARDAIAALEALDVRPDRARRAIELALEALGPAADVSALVREGLKHRR